MYFVNDSDDWSCAEQTLYNESLEGETENSTALIRTTEAVLVVYHLTIILVGFTLCCLVIFLVAATKKLQKVSLLLATKILIVDLLYAFLGATSTISSSVMGHWVFGAPMCTAVAFFLSLFGLVRSFTLAVMAADSFLLVFAPIAYCKVNKKTVTTLLVVAWLAAVAISAFSLPGLLDCYGYRSVQHTCFIASAFCHSACRVVGIMYFSVFTPPASIMTIVLYTCLFCKARKLKRSSSNARSDKEYLGSILTFLLISLCTIVYLIPLSMALFFIRYIANNASVDYVVPVINSSATYSLVVLDPIFLFQNKNVREAFKMKFIKRL